MKVNTHLLLCEKPQGLHVPANSAEHVATGLRRRRARGFTLSEAIVSFTILMALGGSFITLYLNVITTSAKVTYTAYSSMDSGKAMDRLNSIISEARRFEFMDNGTTGPASYTVTNLGNNPNYMVSLAGFGEADKIVTGIRIVHPATVTNLSVKLPSGNVAMSGTKAIYDYRTDGGFLDVYRSDRNGRPAPSNGNCLWMRGTINGTAVPTDSQAASGIDGRPLVDTVADWAGAVQFLQGRTNEVRIKIVTGKKYRPNHKVTSESTSGKVTNLAAATIYLRNHDPNGVQAGSAHGKTQYFGL